MYEYRSFEAMSGLLHLCTFILLHLSGNREFGVALNKSILYKLPVTDTLPLMTSEGNPYGTHVDLCIITFHKMIVDGMRSLQSLYNCMLTILSNISPYIKTLSLISSLKLINLYEIFSSKKFLLSNLYNNQYIFFLLDIFNNIIQYQYNGNHHLIYAMVRRKEQFDKLINLDIDEKEMDKETKTVETTTTTTTTTVWYVEFESQVTQSPAPAQSEWVLAPDLKLHVLRGWRSQHAAGSAARHAPVGGCLYVHQYQYVHRLIMCVRTASLRVAHLRVRAVWQRGGPGEPLGWSLHPADDPVECRRDRAACCRWGGAVGVL